LVYIGGFHKDIKDLTVGISFLVIKSMNGDYDGPTDIYYNKVVRLCDA